MAAGDGGDAAIVPPATVELLRNVTDEAPVMLNLMDADDRVVFANRRTLEFFGMTEADFLGRGWERMIHPDDLPALLEASARSLGSRRDNEVEFRCRRHDGAYRWMRAVAVARHDAEGTFLGFIESTEDITEAKAAQAELARQREALHQAEKLAALGSLLAGVAHELNNPLSILVSHAQLLEEAAPDGKTLLRAGKIRAAAERCSRIVASFLAMARRRDPARTATDLNRIVEATLELVSYRLRTSGIAVERELAADLPVSWADADQLQQVVMNLVVNAEQALAECDGPRRLRLATRFDAATGRLRLEVADSGPGVPPGIRHRIFEPYFTTKPLGAGTGVGLSLCHGIVAAHGGTIAIEDAPGGGARFVVELPHLPASTAAPAPPAEAAPGVAPRTILVVDDEPDLASALAEILVAAGHRVDVAEDGRAALERVAAADYALVVSDLRMPGLDGPALHRALVARDPAWAVRTVFITGDTLSPASSGFLAAAGRPFIEKPFDAATVRRVVAEALAAAEGG